MTITIHHLSMFLSVITVVRNDAGHITQTLEREALKTVPVEHIVVDGASTDGPLEICSSHGVLKLVSERNRGIYDAMNEGLRMASGGLGLVPEQRRYLPQ